MKRHHNPKTAYLLTCHLLCQTERNKRTGETASVEAVAEALSEGQPEALQPLLLQENARVQKRASIVQVRALVLFQPIPFIRLFFNRFRSYGFLG